MGKGTLGQFGQISLESRTESDAKAAESRPSESQGDPTSDPHFENRGQTVQMGGQKRLETRAETDQTHRETSQEKRTQGH